MIRFLRIISAMIVGLTLGLCVQFFLGMICQVSGTSMVPTLPDHKFVLVSRISHIMNKTPDYGDIVIIDSRVDRPRTMKDDIVAPFQQIYRILTRAEPNTSIWVKRVIGKAGDTLSFKNGHVYRNGQVLEEDYLLEDFMTYTVPAPYTIPENTVFVMGDNRNHSTDSRFIGPVPIDHVLGTVVLY